MADYTEAFARFILECKRSYEDIIVAIDRGDVPPGRSAKVTIKIPPHVVDQIRFECIARLAESKHG